MPYLQFEIRAGTTVGLSPTVDSAVRIASDYALKYQIETVVIDRINKHTVVSVKGVQHG